jgi:hypothetical protein
MLKVIVLVTCLLVLDHHRRSLRRQSLERRQQLRQQHLAFIRSASDYRKSLKPSQRQGEQPFSPEDRQRLVRVLGETLGEIPITLRLRFPHRTVGVLFIGLCLFGLFVAHRTGKLGVFESGLLFFPVIQSLRVALGLLYRISLSNGVISRRAFGQPPVSIAIADITSVEPACDLTTLATSHEPLPGFTVNGRSADGASKTINVSTK